MNTPTADRMLREHELAELLLANVHKIRWAVDHAIKYTESHNLPRQRRLYHEFLADIHQLTPP